MRTVIHGGEILTLDAASPMAEAMVIDGDTILATGDLGSMLTVAGKGAGRLDLRGSTAMPGIIDTHPHFIHFAAVLGMCVDILDAKNHDDIAQRIRERARTVPAGEWIITTPVGEPHYFTRRSWRNLAEGCLPNRTLLDAIAPNHPVMIAAWGPRIPNVCAMNTVAMRRLGITASLPSRVSDVWIEKEPDGEPSGIFRGSVTNYYNPDPFWLSLAVNLPIPTADDWNRGARLGQLIANSRGVTAAYEGHVMAPEHIDAYRLMREAGESTLRVLSSLEAAQYGFDFGLGLSEEDCRANFALALRSRSVEDDLFRTNGLTLSRGGPCWPGFLRTDQTIRDPYGRATRGHTFVPQNIEREAIEFCLKNDLRLNMVQGAYQDHREFLESLQPFLSSYDIPSKGWIMQHNILISPETIRRYAELGFHLSTSMSFTWGKGDLFAERIGRDCLSDLIPLGRMMDSGANVTLGSDWGPARPFEHIAFAETHEFAGSGHRNLQPGMAVSRLQALKAWTSSGATLMNWSGIGALRAGYKADIAVVDRNPLTCDNDALPKIRVLKTMLNGREVYDTGDLSLVAKVDLPEERRSPQVDTFARAAGPAAWKHICGPACSHSARASAGSMSSQEVQ